MTETQQAEVGGNGATRIYEGTPALNAALAAVQRDLPRIDKGKTAEVPTKAGGKYTYTYADLADVSAQILPLLGRHGLSFTTWPTLTANRFVLRYELLHESGESKGGEYPLPADAGAQALGSAITYARRYCLCAVTGVAPDDDDDAAAAEAKGAAQRAAEKAEQDREREQATQSVMGAWANQYGAWDGPAAAQMFATWSKGGEVAQAPPAQLRAFTGYLLSLPAADAGSTPSPEASQYNDPFAPLSDAQRVRIIACLKDLGLSERQARLQWMSSTLGRSVASTSDLTMAEAGQLIETLNGGVDVTDADI